MPSPNPTPTTRFDTAYRLARDVAAQMTEDALWDALERLDTAPDDDPNATHGATVAGVVNAYGDELTDRMNRGAGLPDAIKPDFTA